MAHTDTKSRSSVCRHWDSLHFIDEIPMNPWSWGTCQGHSKIGGKYWPHNPKPITNCPSSLSLNSQWSQSAHNNKNRKGWFSHSFKCGKLIGHKIIWPMSESLFWHYPCPSLCPLSTVCLLPPDSGPSYLSGAAALSYLFCGFCSIKDGLNNFSFYLKSQQAEVSQSLCPRFHAGLSPAKASEGTLAEGKMDFSALQTSPQAYPKNIYTMRREASGLLFPKGSFWAVNLFSHLTAVNSWKNILK